VGAAAVIDAAGRYILPGAIDVHAHPVYLDNMGATSVAGAAGGVTTIIHFGYVRPGMEFIQTLQAFREEGEAKSVLDFGLHAGLFDVENQLVHIPAAFEMGITSYKVFMTYAKLKWMTDDYQMLAAMEVVKAHQGLVMAHCENGLATDYLEDKILREGRSTREAFMAMRPGLLEGEATYRAMCLAQVAGCPIYIVHVSAAPVLAHIRRAKAEGWRVLAETCPQYLTLTDETTQALGPLAKIGPPLRTEDDQEALWRGLAEGTLDIVGSDHAPKDKRMEDDFFEAPFGSPQIETMLSLVHDRGVNAGRITLPRLAQVTAENPARAFGLYPRKGVLEAGCDADLVIFDPGRSRTISRGDLHSKAGYSLYEGWQVLGWPVLTMQRGRVIVEEGRLRAEAGGGRYLRTSTAHLHR
jgi:dihydropyrimidinase